MTDRYTGLILHSDRKIEEGDIQALYSLRGVDHVQALETPTGSLVAVRFEAPLRSDDFDAGIGLALERFRLFGRVDYVVSGFFGGGGLAEAAPFLSRIMEVAREMEPRLRPGMSKDELESHVEKVGGWRRTCMVLADLTKDLLNTR